MSIEAIGDKKGYATSLLGSFKPESGSSTASAIRGYKPEDNIGAALASGNINPPQAQSNSF